MGRRVFNREFKLEAVKLVLERGMSAAQVARDLGIQQNVVSRWVREARADKAQAFPGRGQMKADDAEVARLKRELAKTKAERDASLPEPKLILPALQVNLRGGRLPPPDGNGISYLRLPLNQIGHET